MLFLFAACINQMYWGCSALGIGKAEIGINSKIINGRDAASEEAPYMMALYTNDEKYFCGAFLITLQSALTANHCTYRYIFGMFNEKMSPDDLYGGVGNANRLKIDQRVRFSKIKSHPEYDSEYNHDISILILKEKLELSGSIKPIALPRSGSTFDEETGIVYGWGRLRLTDGNTGSTVLQAADQKMVSLNECKRLYKDTGYAIHDSELCAGGTTTSGPCEGDSGIPLVYNSDGKQIAIGVLSGGGQKICTQEGLPGIYVSSSAHAEWIKKNSVGDVTFV